MWIYDTKGFEPLSDNEDIFRDMRKLLADRKAQAMLHHPQSPEYHAERIHAVWWVTAERFEPDCAKKIYETFGEDIPIFVVVNKCDKAAKIVDDAVQEVVRHCSWARKCVPVVASPQNGPLRKLCSACGEPDIFVNEEGRVFMCSNASCGKKGEKQELREQYGMEGLLEGTVEFLPSLVAHSFLVAQRDYLQDLNDEARKRIMGYTTLAAVIGATPIPFSDFPLLMANEVMMFKDLAQLYDIKVDPKAMKQVILAFSGMSGGALAGLALGSGIKLIPFFGTIFGGATSATIAGTVTYSIGMVLRELLRRVRKQAPFGEVTVEQIFPEHGRGRDEGHVQGQDEVLPRQAEVNRSCSVKITLATSRWNTLWP